jgi:hypothetical protein
MNNNITDHTSITIVVNDATYSITIDDTVLSATEYFQYCIALAKAQGYMLPSIQIALEVALNDITEEISLRPSNV